MINDLNRTMLMGHVGADAEQRSETAPVTFNVATSDRWIADKNQRQSRTEWHPVAVVGTLGKYPSRTRSYEKPAGDGTVTVSVTEIVATQIERVAAASTESE